MRGYRITLGANARPLDVMVASNPRGGDPRLEQAFALEIPLFARGPFDRSNMPLFAPTPPPRAGSSAAAATGGGGPTASVTTIGPGRARADFLPMPMLPSFDGMFQPFQPPSQPPPPVPQHARLHVRQSPLAGAPPLTLPDHPPPFTRQSFEHEIHQAIQQSLETISALRYTGPSAAAGLSVPSVSIAHPAIAPPPIVPAQAAAASSSSTASASASYTGSPPSPQAAHYHHVHRLPYHRHRGPQRRYHRADGDDSDDNYLV